MPQYLAKSDCRFCRLPWNRTARSFTHQKILFISSFDLGRIELARTGLASPGNKSILRSDRIRIEGILFNLHSSVSQGEKYSFESLNSSHRQTRNFTVISVVDIGNDRSRYCICMSKFHDRQHFTHSPCTDIVWKESAEKGVGGKSTSHLDLRAGERRYDQAHRDENCAISIFISKHSSLSAQSISPFAHPCRKERSSQASSCGDLLDSATRNA